KPIALIWLLLSFPTKKYQCCILVEVKRTLAKKDMKNSIYSLTLLLFMLLFHTSFAEDGYRLWLRYELVKDQALLDNYREVFAEMIVPGNTATGIVAKRELQKRLGGHLGMDVRLVKTLSATNSSVAGTPDNSSFMASLDLGGELKELGSEGYLLLTVQGKGRKTTVIAANTDIGMLYGSFHLLRLIQTNADIDNLSITNKPKIQHRILNHWDNLDRTVERGYAGFSLWDWHKLPDYIDQRYLDYARANASIGINGTVLTN